MSGEREREQAIVDGANVVAAAPPEVNAIEALLDAGWVPPRQHDEELAAIASWQRDARRAFAAIGEIADRMSRGGQHGLAMSLRDALGQQFLTPKAGS